MKIMKLQDKWKLFERSETLILMDESTLDRIVQDPSQPLINEEEKGFSGEKKRIYGSNVSLMDVCRSGREHGAKRLELSYDFFFGGSKRENYPDSPATLAAYKVICDTAKKYGMGFSASIVSPLDIGGGYARKSSDTGRTMQYKECEIGADGSYRAELQLQTQWTNNKGPIKLKLLEVKAFAFNEERIPGTPYYYVDENAIDDISSTATHQVDESSLEVTQAGYGHGKISVAGKAAGCGKNRCLIVLVYATPELDYFSPKAAEYMKSVIDLHNSRGIRYEGFYSDEMHIQFDWDLENHFGHDTEINTRYLTGSLAEAYARRYGGAYVNFPKYLVYFAYHQHDFLPGEEGKLPSQHVFGKSKDDIVRTWKFRKRYFDMLQRRVVDLCKQTKDYAESLFGGPIMTRAHSTWQESPTCDHFYAKQAFCKPDDPERTRYDYSPGYQWSSSIREDMSACYDYFKWNEYLTGGGTDHPEGGFIDRNYYGSAFAASLALLNRFPFSYYGFWGSPKPVLDRLGDVGVTYGNQSLGYDLSHNFIQGLTPRISDILTVYPLDLNYVEERFGSWMVQYGYTDYITEEKLLENCAGFENGMLKVKSREYRALVIFYSPLAGAGMLRLAKQFLDAGGKVVWCSSPAMDPEENAAGLWEELFGIRSFGFEYGGLSAQGGKIRFGGFKGVSDMEIPTSLLPDHIYPVVPGTGASAAATLDGKTVGTVKAYASGGLAVYLGFRPRDDQSRSTGADVDTLFRILLATGCYDPNGCEAASRPAESRYIVNRFPNGTVSLANHMRSIRENWYGSFFRDEAKDSEIMKSVALTPCEVELKDERIAGHRITYSGEGALSFRTAADGTLTGFAGKKATGIAVDGKSYVFSAAPGDIAWLVLDKNDLEDGIEKACAVKCSGIRTVKLPFDATGMKAGLCPKDLGVTGEKYTFTVTDHQTVIDITPEAQGQWIMLYQ